MMAKSPKAILKTKQAADKIKEADLMRAKPLRPESEEARFVEALDRQIKKDPRFDIYKKMVSRRDDIILSRTNDEKGLMISILAPKKVKVVMINFIDHPTKSGVKELFDHMAKTVIATRGKMVRVEAEITDRCGNYEQGLVDIAYQVYVESKILPGRPVKFTSKTGKVHAKIV
jgi:hypothetical protein